MKLRLMGLLSVCVLASPALAVGASETPFTFTAGGGVINDGGINFFPLVMGDPDIVLITSLQLDITGLSHPNPTDLDIFLIDPFGQHPIEIMTDRGDMVSISGVNLTFADGAAALPPENTELFSGTYLPEGLGVTDNGFSEFIGTSGGTDAWLLVIIDDDPDTSPGQQGFASFTLSGAATPEPVTLSLLALGAVATLRRRRR